MRKTNCRRANDVNALHTKAAGAQVSMHAMLRRISTSGLALLLTAGAVLAEPVGRAVEVSQDATITSAGQTTVLQEGMTVALGDEVATGNAGRVQLLFTDETRMAVGAGSSLVIEDVLFDGSGSSSNFVVEAVSGVFRFLSGNSPNDSYSVRTPTATMGIRGTTFDFSLSPDGGVDLTTLEGEVRLCGIDGRCARVSGGCAAVTLSAAGDFEVPESRSEKRELLRTNFPFILDQRGLLRDFRAPVGTCGRLARVQNGSESPAATTPSAPAPDGPDRDGSGGAQAGGGAASSGGGGSTAGGTSAGSGGPGSGPGDADAGGGGASAGGASAGGGGASAGGN